jgi:SNF2 family DNA or RNA helicase
VSPQAEKHTDWAHQVECLAFILNRYGAGHKGAMAAMEPGTGKSRVAIKLIEVLTPWGVLIVCPLRIISVWQRQLSEHATFPYIFRGLDERAGSVADKTQIAREAIALARAARQTLILAINYESVRLEPFASFGLRTVWPLIIADECHRLQSAAGKCSRYMGRIGRCARHSLGLSGTPLPHSWLNLWGQCRFLDPGLFDHTYTAFKLRYGIWGGFQGRELVGWRDEEDFKRKFASVAFHVGKEVLDLPPEMDEVLYTDLTPAGRRIYGELEANFITWLGEAPEEELTVKNALGLLLRLQQLTGGMLRDDQGEEHSVDTSKEALLADWLEDQPPDEPITVFAHFIGDLDSIGRAATRAGVSYSEVSGRSPHGIAEWQAGKSQLLIAQIQTASEGQDFTRARYCVFYSMGFSLYQYVQARARVHRAGQANPVVYYHLLCRETIDERILRAVQNRWEVVQTILKEMKAHAIRSRLAV